MRNATEGWPRPFAVGVLAVGAGLSHPDRSAARLDLALDTYKLGYFLIDTIEIDTHGTGYLAAELLVSRTTPDALVVRGPVDADWLHALADRHPLEIHSGEERTRTARITGITRDALRERFRGRERD
ncbi:MAG TPA: hypothetical protein VFP72_20285 [Kineosporiaceae bacterium]|nr:hypothetical protein [Kineosporiaceae bacterium]